MAETPGSTLQRLAAATGGVVTLANLLDVVALVGAWWAGPRLGSWKGYAVGAPSYFADLADGIIARRTGTVTRSGKSWITSSATNRNSSGARGTSGVCASPTDP